MVRGGPAKEFRFGRMRESFAIHIFYADGASPESGERRIIDLSPKWVGICSDLLSRLGPVLKHNMGSTLSHFDIVMAGPMIELHAHDQLCFRLAISLGTQSEQDQTAVAQFRELWTHLATSAGNEIDSAAARILNHAPATQCILVLDVGSTIEDGQKLALLQLGEHLSGAYMSMSTASHS